MGLKVALVGLAQSTHDRAPWDDPTWQKWGLAWDKAGWSRMDQLFEMHEMRIIKGTFPGNAYLDHLLDCGPVYMQQVYDEVPDAQTYPLAEVTQTIGVPYFMSSVAYMLALAIHQGAEEIALWGVDMAANDEYACQKANAEYLIGLARGKGIVVHIPDESPLCKFHPEPFDMGGKSFLNYGRYGVME
jgi:hypothetical protein